MFAYFLSPWSVFLYLGAAQGIKEVTCALLCVPQLCASIQCASISSSLAL